MSISSKQYAEIMYFILEEVKDEKMIKKSIGKLAKLIVENQGQGEIDRIISRFNELLRRKRGVVEVKVVSAKKLSKEQEDLTRKSIAKKLGLEEELVSVSKEIDETLIGGISIQIGDEIIDGSLKAKFEKLENSLA